MLRQRLRTRSFPLARVSTDAVVVVLALALVWGGAMLVLLALKASSSTVDGLSGYRTAYDYLATLTPQDITVSVRRVAAIGGLGAAAIFGYLAWRAVPRPYLARTDLRLSGDERGTVDVNARAIERAAELAVLDHPSVAAARARYATDDMTVDISVNRADALPATLEDVHRRARDSLVRHELPALPVNITLVRLERTSRRELR
jgi:hypothetical protein